jgi:hypothetical protein
MVSSNKSLLTQASIGVNKSSFLIGSIDPIDFNLGEIIKSNLNQDGEYDDICVIEGIRYERNENVWIYRLRVLVSLSHWYETEKLTYKPNDEVEVLKTCLLPMKEQDYQRFERAFTNYQKTLELA